MVPSHPHHTPKEPSPDPSSKDDPEKENPGKSDSGKFQKYFSGYTPYPNGRKTWVSILIYIAERFGIPTAFSIIIIFLVTWASRSIYNDILLPISSKHLEFLESVDHTLS